MSIIKLKTHTFDIFVFSLIVIVLVVFAFVFTNNFRQKQREEARLGLDQLLIDEYNRKISKYDNLIGWQLSVINDIINEPVEKMAILYLFSGNDCSSCIDRGFDVIKLLESEKINMPIYVISDNANISTIQNRNNYREYIFTDNVGSIRQNLKFCLTPVVFLMTGTTIGSMYFPVDKYDNEARESFLKTIQNSQKQ
jgi:hypothetical protein